MFSRSSVTVETRVLFGPAPGLVAALIFTRYLFPPASPPSLVEWLLASRSDGVYSAAENTRGEAEVSLVSSSSISR